MTDATGYYRTIPAPSGTYSAQASAAAAKVMTLFARDELEREPIVAKVDERRCVACLYCQKVCPYGLPIQAMLALAHQTLTLA